MSRRPRRLPPAIALAARISVGSAAIFGSQIGADEGGVRFGVDRAAAEPPTGARVDPRPGAAPARGASVDPTADIAAELARLAGHRVELAADGQSYRIVDIAGEGPPLVGHIERRGRDLWLRAAHGPARRLAGPLAHPRMAGPHYKVWVIGDLAPDGSLVARRLGVLAPP